MSKFVTQDGIERLIGIVKSELDGKINEPTADGTSGQVLTTDGNGGRTWTTVGGPDNLTATTLTLGNYTISHNTTNDTLDFTYIGG